MSYYRALDPNAPTTKAGSDTVVLTTVLTTVSQQVVVPAGCTGLLIANNDAPGTAETLEVGLYDVTWRPIDTLAQGASKMYAVSRPAGNSEIVLNYGANLPGVGDRITVPPMTYSFQTNLAGSSGSAAGTSVLISTADPTWADFTAAVNLTGVEGTEYSVGTLRHPNVVGVLDSSTNDVTMSWRTDIEQGVTVQGVGDTLVRVGAEDIICTMTGMPANISYDAESDGDPATLHARSFWVRGGSDTVDAVTITRFYG